MDWVTSIHQAIQYIEEHLREELTIREIAQQAALSPFYFQKGFAGVDRDKSDYRQDAETAEHLCEGFAVQI